MVDTGKVYNVKHVDFHIRNIEAGGAAIDTGKLQPVQGISSEGFGITPTSETEIIEGLKGEEGFSVDPSDGAEVSLTLKSTSPSLKSMIQLYNEQQDGNLAPFTVEVVVSSSEETGGTNAQEAFGFSKIIVQNCMLVSYASFETDDQSAPDYEFEMIGYGLEIEEPQG